MTVDGGKHVVIKIEIHVPTCGGEPTVAMQSSNVMALPQAPQTPIAPAGQVHILSGISEPPPGPTRTLMTGQICLRGTVNNPSANQVWAQIFQAGTPIPASPGAGATQCTFDAGSGTYTLPLLGGVTGFPNSNPHQVVTWEYVYPHFLLNDNVTITPVWGMYTECTYPEFSLPKSAQSASHPEVLFELLPVKWSIETKSFAGEQLHRFNGIWELRLRSSARQQVLYCNGGDRITTPRIQMILESPFAEFWQLCFEVGDQRVIYQLPAKEFSPRQTNQFSQPMVESVADDGSVPPRVVVRLL